MKNSFQSEPFKFIVDGKPVYVHRELIARVSKPLDRMINGGMREAKTGEAELKNVDGATFARFCHWVYAGHYPAAKHAVRPEKEAADKAATKAVVKVAGILIRTRNSHNAVDHFLVSATSADRPSPLKRMRTITVSSDSSQPANRKEALKKSFHKLRLLQTGDVRTKKEPRANSKPSEDYTDVFLSHARLYVFAEQYDIQPLKRTALNNLHTTLKKFWVWRECVSEIVTLIRFVYNSTSKPDYAVEPMRNMLMLFVGCEMDSLVKTDEFRGLLDENRELLFDFCSMVAERIKEWK